MKYRVIIILLLGLFVSCENLSRENPVPEMRVDLTLNILQDAPMLDVMGGYKEVFRPLKHGQFVGYGGILVFHTFDDSFVAFDLACPHDVLDTLDNVADIVRVEPNMAGQAVCPVCGTTYDVGFSMGYPVEGPSQHPLRQYRIYQSGYTLHVIN